VERDRSEGTAGPSGGSLVREHAMRRRRRARIAAGHVMDFGRKHVALTHELTQCFVPLGLGWDSNGSCPPNLIRVEEAFRAVTVYPDHPVTACIADVMSA
jgi:hypothetical protein